jgi:hypothetical protein
MELISAGVRTQGNGEQQEEPRQGDCGAKKRALIPKPAVNIS